MKVEARPLMFYPPDTRGVPEPRYGRGNNKIGQSVFTYSRLPGHFTRTALGGNPGMLYHGTCPGSTPECEAICYARRPVTEERTVFRMWAANSATETVPPIPAEARLLRIHISGDFTSNAYIRAWIDRITERPDVTVWAYTRSWRCPELLGMLEILRALPNVQLFASMDSSTIENPPLGWRIAWIDGDKRVVGTGDNRAVFRPYPDSLVTSMGYVCPEETGRRRDCVECGYCFKGQKHDVVFLKH